MRVGIRPCAGRVRHARKGREGHHGARQWRGGRDRVAGRRRHVAHRAAELRFVERGRTPCEDRRDRLRDEVACRRGHVPSGAFDGTWRVRGHVEERRKGGVAAVPHPAGDGLDRRVRREGRAGRRGEGDQLASLSRRVEGVRCRRVRARQQVLRGRSFREGAEQEEVHHQRRPSCARWLVSCEPQRDGRRPDEGV